MENKLIYGLIAIIFTIAGIMSVYYFYPTYIGYDNCIGGSWENVTTEVYYNDTFPRMARYYCSTETDMTVEECLSVSRYENPSGCKWGGKTSKRNDKGNQYRLYVMEDPVIPSRTDYVKLIYTHNGLTEPYTIYEVCNPTELDYSITKDSDFKINFLGNTGRLKDWGMKLGVNTSTIVPKYKNVCNPYTEPELPNNSIPYYQNCSQYIDSYYVKKSWEYVDYDFIGQKFNKGECYRVKVWGKINPEFRENVAIDNVISYAGMDFTEYDWWNLSCNNRNSIQITPTITDGNQQHLLNLSYNIDWNKAYVILNATNAELSFINITQESAWTNSSVTAGTPFGVEVYYNCSATVREHNYSEVMLEAFRWETQADINSYVAQGSFTLNLTEVWEGDGSANSDAGGEDRLTMGINNHSNFSVVGRVFWDSTDTADDNWFFELHSKSDADQWQVGQRTNSQTNFTDRKIGFSGNPITILPALINNTGSALTGRWGNIRFQANSSNVVNLFIDDVFMQNSSGFINTPVFDSFSYYNAKAQKKTNDIFFLYRDYDGDNPGITVGVEELNNVAPVLNLIECQNATGWIQSFLWKEVIGACRVNCTDANDDNLAVNLSMYTGVASWDTNDNNDTYFLNMTNTSYDGFFHGFNFANLTVEESGLWTVIGQCSDGTFSDSSSFSWNVSIGYLNSTLITPATNLSYQNDTTNTWVGECACTGGECANVSCLPDPV